MQAGPVVYNINQLSSSVEPGCDSSYLCRLLGRRVDAPSCHHGRWDVRAVDPGYLGVRLLASCGRIGGRVLKRVPIRVAGGVVGQGPPRRRLRRGAVRRGVVGDAPNRSARPARVDRRVLAQGGNPETHRAGGRSTSSPRRTVAVRGAPSTIRGGLRPRSAGGSRNRRPGRRRPPVAA